MSVATVAVSVTLAALLVFTAVRKLGKGETTVAAYRRVGVPENWLNALAYLLLAAAAGLIAGLWWRPIGIAASLGLVLYFVFAIGAHVRFRDLRHAPTPVVYLLLAVAAAVLHLA
jgi:uncharacterized membrane protein YbjE (DUF340 family)